MVKIIFSTPVLKYMLNCHFDDIFHHYWCDIFRSAKKITN